MFKLPLKFFLVFALFSLSGLFVSTKVEAYVASSTNYRIETDSVNSGGTEDAVSTNYGLRDTVGEVATGLSDSSAYNVSAGYRAMLESYISISSPANVTLLPEIDGAVGGAGTGSASWTVATDAAAGYTMLIKASSNPAMQSSGDTFADYVPAGANPDFTWSVADTDAEFGFSPDGVDVVAKYLDNGVACNVGILSTANACWNGLSTANDTIAQAVAANAPAGTVTTVSFQAEAGSAKNQPAGNYVATITLTAIAN